MHLNVTVGNKRKYQYTATGWAFAKLLLSLVIPILFFNGVITANSSSYGRHTYLFQWLHMIYNS